jgi:hypothetical protein
MAKMKKSLARKAVKVTALHTARGAASKVKRSPVRAVTLLGIGAAFGAIAGWMLARGSASGAASAGAGS